MSSRSPSSKRHSRGKSSPPPQWSDGGHTSSSLRSQNSRLPTMPTMPSIPAMPALPDLSPIIPPYNGSFHRSPQISSTSKTQMTTSIAPPRSDSLRHLASSTAHRSPRPKSPPLAQSGSFRRHSQRQEPHFLDYPNEKAFPSPQNQPSNRLVRSDSLALSSLNLSRSPSISSSDSGQSQTIVTPLPDRQKRRSKLLPAIPLSVEVNSPPLPSSTKYGKQSESRRKSIRYDADQVHIVVNSAYDGAEWSTDSETSSGNSRVMTGATWSHRNQENMQGSKMQRVSGHGTGSTGEAGDEKEDMKQCKTSIDTHDRDISERPRSSSLRKSKSITPPRPARRSSTFLSHEEPPTPPISQFYSPLATSSRSVAGPAVHRHHQEVPSPEVAYRSDFSTPRTNLTYSRTDFTSPKTDFTSPKDDFTPSRQASRPSLSSHSPSRSHRPDFSDPPRELQPPRPILRSVSPSDSQCSDAPTPRAAVGSRPNPIVPYSSNVLNAVQSDTASTNSTSTTTSRKRDSTQRRLSALRGLVANLDFSQHWGVSERSSSFSESDSETDSSVMFWACTGSFDTLPSAIGKVSDQDHGWPSPSRKAIPTISDKRKSMTPPRKSRMTRSGSDHNLPEPPRPRQRKEVFDVASSGISKCFSESSSPTEEMSSSWRESIGVEACRRAEQMGPLEVKRQEVIWEMCETEAAFLKSVRTTLRLFATPLKTPQGRWIDGIQQQVTELFDALEGVAHAHGILCASQRDMRRKTGLLNVGQFVASFRNWVDKLEMHEEYLLRFEKVVALVEESVRDPENVFGEFVRMQMKEEVLGSMSLGSMLLKPVQRLTKYPLFLKRLLDATAHPHPAHSELMSLLAHTESIILTLQATKAKEDDYDALISLSSKLHGLPDNFNLAIRGRKLLGTAQVQLVRMPSTSPMGRTGSMSSSRSYSSASSTPSSPWDLQSLSSARTSAFSVSTTSSTPSRSNSTHSHSSPLGRSPSSGSVERPVTPKRRKEDILTMMIFDDLVILAQQPDKGIFKKRQEGLRVISEIEGGVGRVLEVKDFPNSSIPWSASTSTSGMFILTTASVMGNGTNTNVFTVLSNNMKGSPKSPKSPKSSATGMMPVLMGVRDVVDCLAQTTCTEGSRSDRCDRSEGMGGEGEKEVLDEGVWEFVR
ncbi:hypothetical protein TREMEDRAFT_63199 [Tremella mesenterica DSM 1558]|uniref:uncharacterized protein n=1 Tax=Tremella mesenterica (strain ATCC 24925 / CBS 8224 / DSM 1558 / NBRC 9311 / NRRL Y-6157 / RJB 2259-6 / UBC 559-6) TaxID=578456 RepID=UPI0003F49ABC|nr:uncharacterized protein TREMEDRAFT_63199 [Tremella mesenterica DSM 1558]EIW68738.1 hypothetical protein TREMEDRAFT_63199 [Tremella mesenterica DSM 1558]